MDDLELRGKACDVFLIQGAHNVKFFESFRFKSEPDFNETVWPGRWEGSTSDPIYGFSSYRGLEMRNSRLVPDVESEDPPLNQVLCCLLEKRYQRTVSNLVIQDVKECGDTFEFDFTAVLGDIPDITGEIGDAVCGKFLIGFNASYTISKSNKLFPVATVSAT